MPNLTMNNSQRSHFVGIMPHFEQLIQEHSVIQAISYCTRKRKRASPMLQFWSTAWMRVTHEPEPMPTAIQRSRSRQQAVLLLLCLLRGSPSWFDPMPPVCAVYAKRTTIPAMRKAKSTPKPPRTSPTTSTVPAKDNIKTSSHPEPAKAPNRRFVAYQ